MDLYHPDLDRTLTGVNPKTAAVLKESGWVEDHTAPEEGDITNDTTSEEE